MKELPSLSVLVPVFNEVDTIRVLVEKVRAVEVETQIILVDDCSTDGTRELLELIALEQPDLEVLFHPVNRGKGAAIRTALAEASNDVVIVQDADLEYDPVEYPRLLEPIAQGVADVVYGSRFSAVPTGSCFSGTSWATSSLP
jgi:glycosyltransferase involved in cell wall biosynthesis